jgi:hypothetical protein
MIDPNDRQHEIAELHTAVEIVKVEVREIWDMLKELAGRKFPWTQLAGIVVPVMTIITGFSLQSIVTVNLTADRIQQVQKTIEQNSAIQQRQYDSHTLEIKELRLRVEQIEKGAIQ